MVVSFLYLKEVLNLTDYERFQEHGRLRQISKDVDPYSLVYENNNHLYVALSTGQSVAADKFQTISDAAVKSWLTVLFTIGMDKRQQSLS